MQHLEAMLKDIYSFKLESYRQDGQDFLNPVSVFNNYYRVKNITKALILSELLALGDVQLQYQLNFIALIFEKFKLSVDHEGFRKCLAWLVRQVDPFEKTHNVNEMDEEIVDYISFLKEEGLTTKEVYSAPQKLDSRNK